MITYKKRILLTLGKTENKRFLLSYITNIASLKTVSLFATKKTHRYLKKRGIITTLVYKISDVGRNPNIAEMLTEKAFDLIINTPTREKVREGSEYTDGKLIRKTAIATGITLITDPEVAAMTLTDLMRKK